MNQKKCAVVLGKSGRYVIVCAVLAVGVFVSGLVAPKTYASAAAAITLPFSYDFHVNGTLNEAKSMTDSSSPYWWMASGAQLVISNGVGSTLAGNLQTSSPWYTYYSASSPVLTDNGLHPQNVFQMFFRNSIANPSAQLYVKRNSDNVSNLQNSHAYNGESLFARYVDGNNYYFGGIRADGGAVIKKRTNGVNQTLAFNKIFSGTYNSLTSPDLIPNGEWIGLKLVVASDTANNPKILLYMDEGKTGVWKLAAQAIDDPVKYGSPISSSGLVGIKSDFADAQFDSFVLQNANAATSSTTSTPTSTPTSAPTSTTTVSANYDSVIAGDSPVLYLAMNSSATGSELDKSGHGNNGSYNGGTPLAATMPNGDKAADFNGSTEYLTVPSSAALSIPTTHQLTWEAWIRPDTLQFVNASGDGYIDWMGKCQDYSPTCEWESRMYSSVNAEGRPNRLSAYVFNSSAGLGSAADWQPNANLLQVGQWLHIVGEYQTLSTPSGCSSAYPGSINIWVNGVKWSMANHMPTGCMSQYSIIPKASNSPLNIGTMAMDTWFAGAIGKVAVYNYLLTDTQIQNHFHAMTGGAPTGSCSNTCTIAVPTQ